MIDLRANGGGSYIWILDILAAWGYRSSIDLFRDNQWYTASAVEGRRNFLYCETIGSDANPKLVRLRNALGVLTDKNWSQSNGRSAFWLEHQETQLLEHARIFFQHEPTAESKQKRTAKTAILVSSRCASSCEAAIVFLKQLPSVRVFGEPTAGMLTYGDGFPYVLSHSRIQLELGTSKLLSQGKARLPEEGVGIIPDVWTKEYQAEPEAVRWLKAGNKTKSRIEPCPKSSSHPQGASIQF